MTIDKKKVVDSFKRFVTQTAREYDCKDDEIYSIIYSYMWDEE